MRFNTATNLQRMIIVYPFLAPTLLVKELLDAFTQACQVFYAALPIWCTATGVCVSVRREKEGRKLGKKRVSEGEKGNE